MKDDAPEAMTVRWVEGVRMAVETRGHRLMIDQPEAEGGTDRGITPIEMFIGSLGSCIGYFAVRFCRRHQIATDGLNVRLSWDYAEQPHRVGRIAIRLQIQQTMTPSMTDRLRKVVEGCTVHHSLTHPPDIQIELTSGEAGTEK